jgi:hypothetical protein
LSRRQGVVVVEWWSHCKLCWRSARVGVVQIGCVTVQLLPPGTPAAPRAPGHSLRSIVLGEQIVHTAQGVTLVAN